MNFKRFTRNFINFFKEDEKFLDFLHLLENWVSKILSLALVCVILFGLLDLVYFLGQEISQKPLGFFNESKSIIGIFGLFLNILIALELLENITAYLKKHVVQVELVIVTSLIAVARKIIIFDFKQYNGIDLMGLALASISLSISYWIVHHMNKKN